MQFAAFSPVETRRRPLRIAPLSLIAGLTLASLATIGCGVDNSGLSSSSPKLQRDGSAGGMVGKADGATQDAASSGGGAGQAVGGGVGGTVGSTTGEAGTSGGSLGGTGISPAGAAGSGAAGATGSAGVAGSAGVNGAAGMSGAAGVAGTAGMAGVSGAPGLGGGAGVSGTAGTIGVAGQGGAGLGGAGGTGGTGGAGGSGGSTGGRGGAAGRGGTCTPNNCADGCCADNQCVRNTTAQQCGTMGAACVACAPCDLCSPKGQCAIDPTSQWTITADSAQIAKTPPGGGTWDPPFGDEGGSAPDPFCEFENPSGDVTAQTAGVTSTVTDEYSVTWDQVITPAGGSVGASVLMANNPVWRIWVGDEDCGAPGNSSTCGSLGQTVCSYQQPITAAALQSGMLAISNFQSCVSLTLSFSCQASAATTAAAP